MNYTTTPTEKNFPIYPSPTPLKLLIDTGATKSFLNPEVAFKYYLNNIQHEPYIVSSIFQNHSQDYCADIPIFPEFNSKANFKFYLFKFHQTFDGLIGLDNLKLLKAKLDLPDSKLITEHSVLPIEYYETNKTQFYSIQLEPHTITKVRLPVKEAEGTITLPKQELQGAILRETLTEACNQLAWTELVNDTDDQLQIALTEPVKSCKINLEQ